MSQQNISFGKAGTVSLQLGSPQDPSALYIVIRRKQIGAISVNKPLNKSSLIYLLTVRN